MGACFNIETYIEGTKSLQLRKVLKEVKQNSRELIWETTIVNHSSWKTEKRLSTRMPPDRRNPSRTYEI